MRWTFFPRFYPDLQAHDAGRARFWQTHVPLSLGILGLFALPPVERWVGGDARLFFALVLLHLLAFGADVHLKLYERSPAAVTTLRLTLGFAAALSLAIVPGRMLAPLFSFYGVYVLYLTRYATGSLYLTLLIAAGPLVAGAIWDLRGTSSSSSTGRRSRSSR